MELIESLDYDAFETSTREWLKKQHNETYFHLFLEISWRRKSCFLDKKKEKRKGNLDLAKEATTIAILSVTENFDCFKQWDFLYKENLEASVALLKKLVDEWEDHSFKLSLSPSDILTLNRTMKSFMLKNRKGIAEGGANCSLYKEADKWCKVISGRLSRGSGGFILTTITAAVLAVAGALLYLFYLASC